MRKLYCFILLLLFSMYGYGQEIRMTETAPLEQVYGETTESENLLPFNDLNVEFGYVLYQAEVEVGSESATLELENVRDYAVVYLNDKLEGTITDNNKKLVLTVAPGKYTLRLYAENIGRITYGPEILDNNKGLFGSITIDGEEITNWTITTLAIKNSDVNDLQFGIGETSPQPHFHKGYFELDTPQSTYLDISGWGMGEVWINGHYMGSFWEAEKQQSIQIPAESLLKGKNEVVVFEMKNNLQKSMKLSDNPVFK